MFLFIIICVLNIQMLEEKKTKRQKNKYSIPPFQICHVCHAQTCVKEGGSFPPFQMAVLRKTTTKNQQK